MSGFPRSGLPASSSHANVCVGPSAPATTPAEVSDANAGQGSSAALPFRADEPLPDGAEIRLGDRRVTLVSAPGHTPGNCVFFEPDTGALFSGDQVIPGLNSNPGWHWDISVEPPERFRSLPAFAQSLDRIEALNIQHLYPGHREPSSEVTEEIERVRRHHRKRQGQLQEILAEGPTSPYELLTTMFKRLPDRRLWQAMAEVTGHIDALVVRGEAIEQESNGVLTIQLA